MSIGGGHSASKRPPRSETAMRGWPFPTWRRSGCGWRRGMISCLRSQRREPSPRSSSNSRSSPSKLSWVRCESVKKILSDFALFSGVVAVLRYHARGCDLAHLERVRPIRRVRVL
jgi:hypothetical protein